MISVRILGSVCCRLQDMMLFYEPRSHGTAARYRGKYLKMEWAEQAGVMLAIEPVEVNLVKVSDTLRLVKRRIRLG